MTNSKVAVPVGIDIETGAVFSIHDFDESKRGLKCNLKCPNEKCSDQLKAVFTKSESHSNYLSHYRKIATPGCEESALHLQSKMILASQSQFKTSAHKIAPDSEYTDMLGIQCPYAGKSIFGLSPLTFIGPADIEKTIKKDVKIIGDLVVPCEYESHSLEVNFEIKVTHAVDDEKLAKIKVLDITTIEIDVSSLLGKGVLDDSEVLKVIMNPANHKLLLLANSIDEHYKKLNDEFFKQKITAINASRNKWLWSLKKQFIQGIIILPEFEYDFDDDYSDAPWSTKNMVKHLEHLKPKLPMAVNSLSLTHEKLNKFTIKIEINGIQKSIPMIIKRYEQDLDELRDDGESFLYIELEDIYRSAVNLELRWGFNSKAEHYLQLVNNKMGR